MNSIEGQEKIELGLNPQLPQQTPEIISPKLNKSKETTRKKAKSENSEDERKNIIFQLIYEYKDRSQFERIEKLLNQGTNPNLLNMEGKSLLIVACEVGSIDIVQLLLNKNADVNLKDRYGKTALHYAVDLKTENLDLVVCLLDNGASLTAETYDKCTVLHRAIDKGYISIARELLQREPIANIVNAAIESTGDTPLHFAVKRIDMNAIKLLFEYGCDLNKRNKQKKTPLDLAPPGKLTEQLKLLDSKQKDNQDSMIHKSIDTPSRPVESKPEENNFSDLLNQIDKDTKKKNNPKKQQQPQADVTNEDREANRIESPKKPPKTDKRENSNTNHQNNQSQNQQNQDSQNMKAKEENGQQPKGQGKKKKNENTQNSNNQNQRPFTEGSLNSNASHDTAETVSSLQSPVKVKNQKINQQNQNQQFTFNQNFNGPNTAFNFQNQQQANGFVNNFPNQQNFNNQNPQGKGKKSKNPNFNLQQQPNQQIPQQFQNTSFTNSNDPKSNPQTPTQKPANTNFQNIQLNRNLSDGYQNQNKGFNGNQQQGPNAKGRGQGKNKNQNIQNMQNIQTNANFNMMMDMNHSLKMMNQGIIDDPKQKQNMNIPMMGPPFYGMNQNQFYNMNVDYRINNTQIQNSVIVNFPQPYNNMMPPQQYIFPGGYNPMVINPSDHSTPTKGNIYHINMNDQNFLNEMQMKDASETLNQKNRDMACQIELKKNEISEQQAFIICAKSNVMKLKDTIKERDSKILELTKKNQELEIKLKALKGIETHDREVLTEFVFDDILQPDGSILDQKLNVETWKYTTVPNILNDEILEFEKLVHNINLEKKPLFDSLISLIKDAVNEAVPGSECSIYGSFSTGLSLNWSDIDLVIKVPHGTNYQCLEHIGQVLQSRKWVEEVKHIRNTTVPVLKITCINNYLSKKVDISIQETRHNGLACVELVKDYLETYPPLKYLIIILKQFLFHLNLNDTYSVISASFCNI